MQFVQSETEERRKEVEKVRAVYEAKLRELVTQHDAQLKSANDHQGRQSHTLYDEQLKDIHNIVSNFKAKAVSEAEKEKNNEAAELKQ